VASLLSVREFDDRNVFFVTEKGIVKRCALEAFSRPRTVGLIAIGLAEGDRLISVLLTRGDQEIVLVTRNGRAIRFHETDVRTMGRTARGVKGVRLRGDNRVVGAAVVDDEGMLLSVCENGYGKRTEFAEYPCRNRGGIGVYDIKTSARNGKVIGALTVYEDDEVLMITAQGKVVRTAVDQVRAVGRNTQGVTLIRCGDDDHLVAISRVVELDNGEEDEEDGGEAPQPEQDAGENGAEPEPADDGDEEE
jgi:DNA gyrase subunit A